MTTLIIPKCTAELRIRTESQNLSQTEAIDVLKGSCDEVYQQFLKKSYPSEVKIFPGKISIQFDSNVKEIYAVKIGTLNSFGRIVLNVSTIALCILGLFFCRPESTGISVLAAFGILLFINPIFSAIDTSGNDYAKPVSRESFPLLFQEVHRYVAEYPKRTWDLNARSLFIPGIAIRRENDEVITP